MNIKTYESRSLPRLKLIDELSEKCEWDKFDFQVSFKVQELRLKWKKLMDEQSKDEIAAGL